MRMYRPLVFRLCVPLFLATLGCLATGLPTSLPPVPAAVPETPRPTEALPSEIAPAEVPEPGFTLLPSVVNRDPSQAAQSPALAVAGDTGNTWVTWAEDASGGLRQIFVSEIAQNEFLGRGTSLNLHLNVVADQPTITFTGENRAVPWVAWTEPSPGFGNIAQVFASRFNRDTGLWQVAGQDRGGAEPSLNFDTDRAAVRPFVFGGSTDPTRPTVPWVTCRKRVPRLAPPRSSSRRRSRMRQPSAVLAGSSSAP